MTRTQKTNPSEGTSAVFVRKDSQQDQIRLSFGALDEGRDLGNSKRKISHNINNKFISLIMVKGKKTLARKILREVFQLIVSQWKTDPSQAFLKALENVSPPMELRSRRKGSQKVRIPFPLSESRRYSKGISFIIEEAEKGTGSPISHRLAKEIMQGAQAKGGAYERCLRIIKEAEANRGNSYLRWLFLKHTFGCAFRAEGMPFLPLN